MKCKEPASTLETISAKNSVRLQCPEVQHIPLSYFSTSKGYSRLQIICLFLRRIKTKKQVIGLDYSSFHRTNDFKSRQFHAYPELEILFKFLKMFSYFLSVCPQEMSSSLGTLALVRKERPLLPPERARKD